MSIRNLPSYLVDRIAAGEVVERPASVVKELVENSLDAGSGRISVALEAAGLRRIQVVDDGHGMPPGEMRLAMERHATSKLPGDDLLAIHSFGFRGEALPAIASVSDFTMESRPTGAESGWKLKFAGATLVHDEPAGLPRGTRITVDGLFARVPARAKFLKTPRTETQAVADAMRRLAMAHPHVGFRLTADGRTLLDVLPEAGAGVPALAARVQALLPAGADMVPVDFEREDLIIGGLAGLPAASRATSEHQYLFVNGRPVRDRQLVGALRGAYADRLPSGRHAMAALFIALPTDRVDVNVHPAKTEVRFAEPARIRASLIVAIRQALDSAGIRPVKAASADLADALQRGQPYAAPFAGPALQAADRRVTGGYQPPLPAPAASASAGALPYDRLAPAGRTLTQTEPAVAAVPAAETDFPLGVARGQVANAYIIAETVDALVLVDQHAAHERLVLEAMRGRAGQLAVQPLLIPETVTLDPVACDRLEDAAPALAAMGLEIERFGDNAMLIRALPAMLGSPDLSRLLADLADELASEDGLGAGEALATRLDQVAATIACHGSVRAGRVLGLAEMNALLRQMEQVPASGTCNHGRPTFLKLGKTELERLFHRR